MVNEEEIQHKVADYWDEGGGWNWLKIGNIISYSSLVILASVVIRPETDVADEVGWLSSGQINFTVKKTYELARPRTDDSHWVGWKLLWKMDVSQ